ncbi:MAG: helix-turn-helix domain-containing protein [Cyanobacteria bacterium J06621_11]
MTLKSAIWEHISEEPCDALKDWVCSYSGYAEQAERPVRRLEVVKDRVTVIIGFGDRLQIKAVGTQTTPTAYQMFAVGLGGSPLLAEHSGTQRCIEIELLPLAATKLFSGLVIKPHQSVVALSDIWGESVLLLAEQLSEQLSWPSRFALIDQFLIQRFAASSYSARPEVRWAWQELERAGGCISIHQLAKTLGWSDRHFSQSFREHVGVTPKLAARHIRFAHAHQLLMAVEHHELSTIALSSGYSDQSHFTREFYRFSGCTPSTYRQAHFPDLPGTPAEAARSL